MLIIPGKAAGLQSHPSEDLCIGRAGILPMAGTEIDDFTIVYGPLLFIINTEFYL